MLLSLLLISSLNLIGLAAATTVQAWDGSNCNGGAGSVVSIPHGGKCINAPGRHSWEAVGDDVKGYYYSASGCQGASKAFSVKNEACNGIPSGYTSFCVVGHLNAGCGYGGN